MKVFSVLPVLAAAYGDLSLEDQDWNDTPITTYLWQVISMENQEAGNNALLIDLVNDPSHGFLRSNDGRGALWWAWESKNVGALATLMHFGLDILSDEPDANSKPARSFCDEQGDCDADSLFKKAQEAERTLETKIQEITRLKEQEEARREAELDEEFDIGDDEF